MVSWVVLIISGMFEAGWAITLPKTEMFTRLWPSVIFVISMIISVGGLAVAMRHIPTGPGYAVWAGVGAVTTAVIGMLWLGEDINVLDRKSTRLNSRHVAISYAVFCLEKKTKQHNVLTVHRV